MIKKINIQLPGSEIVCMENNGIEPAIVFLHGNSLSSDTFIQQFSDPELQKLRLVAIDLPGHGESAWSLHPETEYNLFHFRDIVIQVLEHLEVSSFIFAGHSLGGHVAMECLPFAGDCKGIFLWGAPPITLPLNTSALFNPDPRVSLLFTPGLLPDELHSLASLLTKPEQTEEIEKMISKSDPAFREQFPISFMQGKVSDEYQMLISSCLPFAVLQGVWDELVNYKYYHTIDLARVWRGKPRLIENSAHSIQVEEPEIFNDLLIQFYSDIFKVN
jgi:pimeloyl-ACP methyl ester carboxylesterase